ncbi:hypothetical protein GCM10011628_07180 [Lactobacillus acetotolerans DSM 20749 = JCM 3825]|nr:hypothetical protein GCM10011628_07180 [Lactobacillus acetotolerans DSM 20749 = JCM 3825]
MAKIVNAAINGTKINVRRLFILIFLIIKYIRANIIIRRFVTRLGLIDISKEIIRTKKDSKLGFIMFTLFVYVF